MARSASVGTCSGRRRARRPDSRDPRPLARDVRRTARPRRARSARRPSRAQEDRSSDAHMSLMGACRRKWIGTTKRDRDARPAPDLVERNFTAEGQRGPSNRTAHSRRFPGAEWCTTNRGAYDCPANLVGFSNSDQAIISAGNLSNAHLHGTGREHIYHLSLAVYKAAGGEAAFRAFRKSHCPAGEKSDGKGLACLDANKQGSWIG